jgi:hypothetical protein
MNVELHRPKDRTEIRHRSRKECNAKQRDRYRAVLLALEGQTTEAIMHNLDRSKNFVQRWAYAYRDGGIDAIDPIRQTGRLFPRDPILRFGIGYASDNRRTAIGRAVESVPHMLQVTILQDRMILPQPFLPRAITPEHDLAALVRPVDNELDTMGLFD